ncbi:MAG: 4-(cytidine 5'-diphospho)-2-C-methyl-D-erythritol kinase, partial [Planctomycetota bacterium]
AVLLFLPGIHCSTPEVFRRFDALPAPPDDGQPDFAEWSSLPAETLLPQLRNDLESAAFALHPTLATLRHELEEHLSRPVRMSGSGSTLFTLFNDAAQAKAAAEQVPGRLVRCVVC